jgi:LmbE family N-acetylglucosaminyl deacetylase
MRALAIVALAGAFACARGPLAGGAEGPSLPELELEAPLRLLVVAPHPDDELIGCGGLMSRVVAEGGRVDIVYVTQGDGYLEGVMLETHDPQPKPEEFVQYGEWRRRESLGVLTLLRVPEDRAYFLGFPDAGIRDLWDRRFTDSAPYRSRTTEAERVPYPNLLATGAPYSGKRLVQELRRLLGEIRPTLLAIPDPRDRHPDHNATGLFALQALAEARDDDRADPTGHAAPPVRVVTYLVHWPSWPDLSAEPPPRLDPPATLVEAPIAWLTFPLTPQESAEKLHRIHVYKTQIDVMGSFLDRFYRSNELFGSYLQDPPPDPIELSPLGRPVQIPPAR